MQKTLIQLKKNISVFKSNLKPIIHAFSHIGIKTIILSKDNKPFPFLTEIQLFPENEKPTLISELPITRELKAIHKILPISKLDGILAGLEQLSITLDKRKYAFIRSKDAKINTWCFDGIHPEFPSAQRYSQSLKIYSTYPTGIGKAYEWRYLDWILRGLEKPIYNLDILMINMFFLIPQYRNMAEPMLDVLAFSPIRFDYTKGKFGFRDSHFFATIVCSSQMSLKGVNIGFNLYGGNQAIERFSSPFKSIAKKIDECNYYITIPSKGKTFADFFINLEGKCYGHIQVSDPSLGNLRTLYYSCYDPELNILKSHLDKSVNNKPELFEIAVSSLFNLLGFSSQHFDKNIFKGEVDVVGLRPIDWTDEG
jgi:hypothetical protein